MKKITPLAFVLFLFMQPAIAQQLTHSASQVILEGNSVACTTEDEGEIIYVNANTFYRHFKLNDFGITSAYDITSIDYGIQEIEDAPSEGFPVTVGIYSVNGNFPNGNINLITEVTENLQDQTLVLHNVAITATISANDEFVVAISVPSEAPGLGGGGQTKFQIGSNKGGINGDGDIDGDGDVDNDDQEEEVDLEIFSYLMADECSVPNPVTFKSQGRPDVKIVLNVNGNSATASAGNLDLVEFSYFPNPVKKALKIKAKEAITSVAVYNILGQQVKSFQPSKVDAELDLTSLVSGTYMVKAQVNDHIGTFKVIKE